MPNISQNIHSLNIEFSDNNILSSLFGVNDIDAPVYFTEDQFTIEPFQERFDNLLCGWTFTIGIKVMHDFDTCTLPIITEKGAGYPVKG